MTELLDTTIKYWPIFAFLFSGVFSLGMLFVKVQMAMNGTKKLFDVVTGEKGLTEFRTEQKKENEHFKEKFKEFIERFDKHHDLDAQRHSGMEAQMSQLLQMVAQKK